MHRMLAGGKAAVLSAVVPLLIKLTRGIAMRQFLSDLSNQSLDFL